MITIDLHNKSIPEPQDVDTGKNILVRRISENASTSVFIDSQLPEFVRSDHPKFVEFIKSYYDWLNQQGNVDSETKQLKKNQDIDTASLEYSNELHKEFLQILPKVMKADKRQVLKYARHFYRAKGTEKSFKLFFRMLYDCNVEFYYPRVDILKTSDGKWITEKSLRVIPAPGTEPNFSNKVVVGKKSGATAFVDKSLYVRTDKVQAIELFLNIYSITGKFLPNEHIETIDGDFAKISPTISKVEFVKSNQTGLDMTGVGYSVGDQFSVEFEDGHQAKIRVASVTSDGAIRRFSISNFGLQYTKPFEIDLDYSNSSPRIRHAISNNSQTIEYIKRGEITAQINISNFLNEASVDLFLSSFKKDGFCHVADENGFIYHFKIDTSIKLGSKQILLFVSHPDDSSVPNNVEIERMESITGLGAKVKITSDAICEYPGYYISNNGQLSESKYLQDGHFYQQFSYVLYSKESQDTYKTNLNEIVHPLGMKFFAGFRDPTKLSAKIKTNRASSFRREYNYFPNPSIIPFSQRGPHMKGMVEDVQYFPVSVRKKSKSQFSVRHDSSEHLGPSNYSLYRDRFRYLPTEKGPTIWEQSLNPNPGVPSVFTESPNSLPIGTTSSWQETADLNDADISNVYNTYNPNLHLAPIDNKLYWGTTSNKISQYANMQIFHFANIIPKSLESDEVPDFVLLKISGSSVFRLTENEHYRVERRVNLFPTGSVYEVLLLNGFTFEISDQFRAAFKDRRGRVVVTNLETPQANKLLIPENVGIKGAHSKINILPEAIVTRGV